MKNDIEIVLPRRIYCIKGNHNEAEQLNIYFKNIMQYCPEDAYVDVECKYGKHYGDFWRLDIGGNNNEGADISEEPFPLKINLRSFDGEIIASSTTEVQLVTKHTSKECAIMYIGDSMTRASVYVEHVQRILPNLKIMGTRTYDGLIYTEGRGGWRTVGDYGFVSCDTSPFMFPAGTNGDKYLGNCRFWKSAVYENPNGYDYMGFQKTAQNQDGSYKYDSNGFPTSPCEGDVVFDPSFSDEGSLLEWENGVWKSIDTSPKWEFNFKKYLKRYETMFVQNNQQASPDIVSILLGANDFQTIKHEQFDSVLSNYIEGIQTMIDSIKIYNPEIKIILNMPIMGAPQDAWGICQGCFVDEARYRHHILKANHSILKKWDNDTALQEGIYISPMLVGLDPDYGFDKQVEYANKHCNTLIERFNNWVHPNVAGYKQMGDVLAAVIQKITS